jgi:hypothetical protein
MTEPRDQSQSGFEPAGGPSEGAHRFWEQYASSRAGRTARNGESTGTAAGDREPRERQAPDHECLEWCPICRGADVVRSTAPPEIRDQWQTFQRDALIMLKALIDAYLVRLNGAEREARDERVQDIRID